MIEAPKKPSGQYVIISDYIDSSKIDELKVHLESVEYYGASYMIDSVIVDDVESHILRFYVPLNNKNLMNLRSTLKRENAFTDIIGQFGSEKSKRKPTKEKKDNEEGII